MDVINNIVNSKFHTDLNDKGHSFSLRSYVAMQRLAFVCFNNISRTQSANMEMSKRGNFASE